MRRRWVPVGFGVAVVLALTSLTPATAAVGRLDAPTTLSPAGDDAEDVQLVADGTAVVAAWARVDGYSREILTAVSQDRGVTWSTPIAISGAAISAENPTLSTDGTTITAAWIGSNGVVLQLQAATSTDGGLTWSSPTPISVGESYGNPDLATDGAIVTAVWEHSIDFGGTSQIYTASSTDGGRSWDTPTPLSPLVAGQSAYRPEVVTNGSTIVVGWDRYDGTTNRVQATSSTDGGDHWSSPATLSSAGQWALYPQLLIAGSHIGVLWHSNDGTAVSNNWIQAASSSDGGLTWSAPRTVSDAVNQTAYTLSSVTDGMTMTAVWTATGFGYFVMTAYSSDGGMTWSSPTVLSTGAQTDYEAEVVSDGTTTTAFWVRLDGAVYQPRPDSPLYGGTYRVQAVSSMDGGVRWSSPTTISSFNHPATDSSVNPPIKDLRLATDGATITAAWRFFDGSNDRVQVASYTPTTRLAGADRFATSALIAQQFATASRVYVANGRNYPDALSAAPAAAHAGGPLLLVDPNVLPEAIRTELLRLNPSEVVVAGGLNQVSQAVRDQIVALLPGVTLVELAGSNRYETSRLVTQFEFGVGVTANAYVVTGRNFPDALAASAAAAHFGGPVILIDGSASSIDDATQATLDSLGVTTVRIAGSNAVVTDAIEADLTATYGDADVIRNAGVDRYATSIAINNDAFGGVGASEMYLALGTGYADALSGAALAGARDAPLFTVPGSCAPQGVRAAITSYGVIDVILLGSTNGLTTAVGNLTPC